MFKIFFALFKWEEDVKAISSRVILITILLCILYIIIICRIISLTVHSDYQIDDVFPLRKDISFRREIIDRSGELLAINLPTVSLFSKPYEITDIKSVSNKLAKILPSVSLDKLLKDLFLDKKFVWIKHNLTLEEQKKINQLGIVGIYFKNWQKRFYPYGNLFSHVLGYVDIDGNGISGMEKKLNNILINEQDSKLQITIDAKLQNIVSEELAITIKKFNALGGVGIIADVNNGEILSLVSKPDFNPHNPGYEKKENLFNRASLGDYELGSILKTLIMAIGFDTGTIDMNDAYEISDFKIANFHIKDYHKKYGWHTVSDIFIHSSNIGTVQIALEIGQNKVREYFNKLGLFSQLSSLEIAEKAHPVFPHGYRWQDIELATISYGYRISISPLHFVQAMIPVVNGGYFYPLTLLKKKDYPKQVVFKKNTSKNMNQLLRLVVSNGSGKTAEIDGYFIGGKTGTANKIISKHYSSKNNLSSFIAVFPTIKPKYIVFVFLDDPKGIKETYGFSTARYTAAPTAKRIIQRMLITYNMKHYINSSTLQEVKTIKYKNEDKI